MRVDGIYDLLSAKGNNGIAREPATTMANATSILAGAARVDITPPIGVWLSGFGTRTSPADGVHDPLYAAAVVVEAGGQKAAIVGCDLIGLDVDLVARVRDLVSRWTGIDGHHLILNSSHTHSGPATVRRLKIGVMDEDYCDALARKIATAVKLANDSRRPADVSFGTENAVVAVNRRMTNEQGATVLGENPRGPIDPTVYALRFDASDGTPLAIVFSYACHPVVFGALDISADFIAYARRTIEMALGDPVVAVFLQGCCGDINPLSGDHRDPESHARELGATLGAGAVRAAQGATPIAGAPILGMSDEVHLPLEDLPAVEEAERILNQCHEKLRQAESEEDAGGVQCGKVIVDWARRVLQCAGEGPRDRSELLAVQALRLGDVAIVGTGAETFIEIGQDIQEGSCFDKTIVLGYTNGDIGYLPIPDAYPRGDYEVSEAIKYYGTLMWAPESAKIVTDACIAMLDRLAGRDADPTIRKISR